MNQATTFRTRASLFAIVVFLSTFVVASCGKHGDYKSLEGVWERKFDGGGGYAVIIVENGIVQGAYFWTRSDSGKFGPKQRVDLDTAKNPKQFDTLLLDANNANSELNKGSVGLYQIEGDRLKIAVELGESKRRPASFTPETTFIFERKGESADFKPKDGNYIKGLTTWVYMQHLSEIFKNDPAIDFNKVNTLPEAITMFNDAAKKVDEVGSIVTTLQVMDVDSRAIAFASEYAQIATRGGVLLREMGQLVKDLNSLTIRRNSDETAGKAFLEWLLGNPGQTMSELDAELLELKRRADRLQSETKTFQENLAKKDQEGVQLRSALSQTYGREYPALKN